MNDLQRTQEWFLARQGKITASECYLLLQKGRNKNAVFSQTCMSYLNRKIAEYYMTENAFLEYVEQAKAFSRAMQWGQDFEDDARERYEAETGIEVQDAPFVPYSAFPQFAGGSPDGLMLYDDNRQGIIEIKCPFNPDVHLRHCLYETADDLKSDCPQYYMQCQMNMMCVAGATGVPCERCDFISYDPRISMDRQISILHIPLDEEIAETLEARLKEAVDYYRTQMETLRDIPMIR